MVYTSGDVIWITHSHIQTLAHVYEESYANTFLLNVRNHWLTTKLRTGTMSSLICPECKSIGSKSRLTEVFWGQYKNGGTESFVDENGSGHYHPSDNSVSIFQCSNGHNLKRTTSNKCSVSGCTFGSPEILIKIEWWPVWQSAPV